jgi:hypothetical protein
MLKPFWVDRGFEFDEIALYSTTFGIAATALGAVVGGFVVARIGIYRSLWWLGGGAITSNSPTRPPPCPAFLRQRS